MSTLSCHVLDFFSSASRPTFALPLVLGLSLGSYPALEDGIILGNSEGKGYLARQLSNLVRTVDGGVPSFCIQPWTKLSGPRNAIISLAVGIFTVHATSIRFQFQGKVLPSSGVSLYYRSCKQCIM
ncbi:hypothetical protein LB504_004943 [Fusarium proliferatum]|nr:hypothetical protein LB504_004943 [Fusarium proliferatum]